MPWGRHAAMAVQRATGHIGDPLNISPFPQTVAVEGMGARKGCHRPKLLGQRLKANAAIGYFDWRDRRRSLGECPRIWRCWRCRDNSGVLGVSGQSGCTSAPSAGTATPGLRGAAAKGGAGGAAAEAGAAAKGAAAKGADGSGTGALADICCCCCNISPTLPEAACAAAASRNFCPRLGFSLIIQASDHPCSTATDSTWCSLRFKGNLERTDALNPLLYDASTRFIPRRAAAISSFGVLVPAQMAKRSMTWMNGNDQIQIYQWYQVSNFKWGLL